MNDRGSRKNAHGAALAIVSASVVLAIGCHHAPEPPLMTASLPQLPPQRQISPPSPVPSAPPVAAVPLIRADTEREARVEVDTHGADVDVRPILDFLANKAGVTLVFSPEINKKVRLHLIDVPVSQALQTVLSLANLTLESPNRTTHVPTNSSVVFYQLPVNVDSLSVEAVMKIFGVGRTMAEAMVSARTVKP